MRSYTITSSSASNITTTFTARLSHRPAHWTGGWWGLADAVGHKLKLPRRIMRPICDHYDIAVGIPKGDLIAMDYTSRGQATPWWLK